MKTVVKLMVLSSRRILGRGGRLRSRHAEHGAVPIPRLGKRLEARRPASGAGAGTGGAEDCGNARGGGVKKSAILRRPTRARSPVGGKVRGQSERLKGARAMQMEAIDDAIDRTRSSGVVDVPSREPSARASRPRTLPASFVPSEDTSVSVRAARIGSPAISRLPQARPALHTLRVFILGSARDRPERLTRSRRRKVLERRGEKKRQAKTKHADEAVLRAAGRGRRPTPLARARGRSLSFILASMFELLGGRRSRFLD